MNKGDKKIYASGRALPKEEVTDSAFPGLGQSGLSKREWFAGMALQGLLACQHAVGAYVEKKEDWQFSETIKEAWLYADKMMGELKE